MVFIFQFVNMVYYIDLQILKNPCIPGIKIYDYESSFYILDTVVQAPSCV